MKFIIPILWFFFITISCANSSRYNRKHWHHWIDQDRDCQNTRQEILIERSEKPVTLNKKGCTVQRGKWRDFYFDELLTDSRSIDVDHLVPLKHAHDIGGENWSREKKKQFANDPENLVLTNKIYNRKKGAKTIAEWLPVDPAYACRYTKQWVLVKKKYELDISSKELETINLLKNKCP
jgi:hypothetical protein